MISSWVEDIARAWVGGPEDRCHLNHETHATIRVPSGHLGDRVSELTVFDWRQYTNIETYCPGNDDVSMSIDVGGDYERPESAMVREIVRFNPAYQKLVIDLGCHIGWYTCMAAAAGCQVLAVDADQEHLRLLDLNTVDDDRVTAIRGWIGPDTPEIPMDSARQVLFVKMDLEGLENEAVRVLAPLLKRGMVDYMMMEVSPVFADHYPDTVAEVVDYGYSAFVVPGTVDQDLWRDRIDLMADMRDVVSSFHQRDMIFARKSLLA